MKVFNKEESIDKIMAYYGDEYAQKRTKKRISISNFKIFLITVPATLLISFVFSLITGLDGFLVILQLFATLISVPTIGALIVEYLFIILEGYGYGISIGFGILFLIIDNLTNSHYISLLMTLLLLIIFCQWYSKNIFAKVVEEVRIELLQNNVNVEIINNKVIFK